MKVSLVSHTQNPLGTLYYVWKQSRHNKPLPSAENLQHLHDYRTGEFAPVSLWEASTLLGYPQNVEAACQHVRDEVQMILAESIPVTENINFVFHIEGMPISLREQAVRHRIGTKFDMRVGVDQVPSPEDGALLMEHLPDLADSTWWSQTSRVISYENFFDEKRFIIPDSIGSQMASHDSHNEHDVRGITALDVYLQCMLYIQSAYRQLVEAGVHIEDARQLIPLGATHGITWGVNLKALSHIVGKRTCWVAQAGLWGEMLMQMIEELVEKVHPIFRQLMAPPCIKKGRYAACPVNGTNCERVAGIDGMPPCPLWVRHQTVDALQAIWDTRDGKYPGAENAAWKPTKEDGDSPADLSTWMASRPVEQQMLVDKLPLYERMWGFDPLQGVPE